MKAKYFVALRPSTDNKHAIHREDCPFLRQEDKSSFLGYFGSAKEAELEGTLSFDNTKRCQFCMKEHEAEEKEVVSFGHALQFINVMEQELEVLIVCIN